MEQKIKIKQVDSLTQKSRFGDGKYFGYKKYKYLGIIKLTTDKKIIGYGETLVGVYSPKLFKINLSFISQFLITNDLSKSLNELNELKRNKFFFDNGILKSIISGVEMAIFDILAQANRTNHSNIMKNFFKTKQQLSSKINIYASAGSIKSSLSDLKKDLEYANKIDIGIFKGRLATGKNFIKKIELLRNEISNFAIDIIANTYEKNENLKNLNLFLKKISTSKPLWIEEILKTNDLFQFKNIKKHGLRFSYGENFNSLIDFINLIELYKFDYINPDLSHLSIFDFVELNRHLNEKKQKDRIIIHCWGGPINFIYSLYCAQVFSNQVKLVEFPITNSSFMDKVYPKIRIKNSICTIDENIKSFKDIFDLKKLDKIQFSRLTFNFN
tara:strand:- start:1056 stop:2210 length:1155 start_codon:yes stop_codon:yes gene_type:complete